MKNALNSTGRPIWFSITERVLYNDSEWHAAMHCIRPPRPTGYPNAFGAFSVRPWVQRGKDVPALANSFLIEYCNNEPWFGFTNGYAGPGAAAAPGGFLSQLDSQQLLTYDNLTLPGAYSDADMLEVCNADPHDPAKTMTAAERRAQFSTFAILTSPLILGGDLRTLGSPQAAADCLDIIANREIIALNQDKRVARAKLVYQYPLAEWPNADRLPPTRPSDSGAADQVDEAAVTAPPPSMTAGLAIQRCNSSDPAQQFVARAVFLSLTDAAADQVHLGTPPKIFTLRPAAAAGNGTDCVTYGGYHLSNLGVARCEQPAGGRSDPCSQRWYVGANSTLRPLGSGTRCLNVDGCLANATVDMALCADACPQGSRQQGKCGAECPGGTDSRGFVLAPSATRPGVLAVRGTMGAHTGCVAVAPGRAPRPQGGGGGRSGGGRFPGDGPLNITVQAWAKTLADGSVGVVVFNRGAAPTSVEVTWPMLGLPAAAVGAVRDLWAHADRGNHTGSYTCTAVASHDVCALRITPRP